MEAVSAIGGSVLSAFFQSLFDKLTSTNFLKYVREGEVLAQLQKWENWLKRIHAVLEDAEEKQMTNLSVKIWVTDLRDLAYDLEDVLDELATEVHRRKFDEIPLSRASKMQKIFHTISFGVNLKNTVKFSAEMVSKIEGITARVNEIIEQKDWLKLGESSIRSVRHVRERIPATSLVNEAKIYGRDEEKKAILEFLKAEASYENVSVLPIVGMGGIGKTTLAQLIYNDPALKFDLKVWVSVGEDFDVLRLSKVILQSVDEIFDAKDLNLLLVKLKEIFSRRKFLIVLDDVWNEDYDLWTLFRSPFEHGAMGSRIIVTTRNQEISLMMGNVPAFNLKELSYNDCLSVFAQHALGTTHFDEHSNLKKMGEEIVKKCQGLPLAAKTLGGLLRGKRNCTVWAQLLNSKIWGFSEHTSGIFPALFLSYHHLPSHLKRCFAYCAIFPKGFQFDENELVLLWMAEGFLQQPKAMKQMEVLGREYFHDLVSRSLFQQSSNNKRLYVMHDLISDLAQYVSGETCFNLDDKLNGEKSYAMVRHSSFTRRTYDNSQRFEGFYKMKSLRTFLALPLFSSWYQHCYLSRTVINDLVPKLKCLRVLSLAGYWLAELPSSIAALKHLRFLNLSYTAIEQIPESYCQLINLQTLILRGCLKLIKLPSGISNLINLRYVDIRDTDGLQEMPPYIGNLTKLHTFNKFIVGEGSGLRITELMKFSNLQGQLRITGLQNVMNIQDAELACLKEKPGLHELDFEWIEDVRGFQNEINELQVLKSLQPHENIRKVSITSYGGRIFPSWIGDPSFINMVELELCNFWKITSLPSLWQLRLLKHLSIEGMDSVKELGVDFSGYGFLCLETLSIKNMLKWEQWSCSCGLNEETVATFPNLHELAITNCPKLVGKLPRSLGSLRKLYLCYCHQLACLPKTLPSLYELYVEECPKEVLRSISDLSSLTIIRITRIPNLRSLPKELIQALVALEDLDIADCSELMYLWQDGANLSKLACLKFLQIRMCQQLMLLAEDEEGHLPCNLEVLTIGRCENLEKLPNVLNSLTSLKELTVYGCPKLTSFPATSLHYTLKCLEIRDCDSLDSLPKGIMVSGNDSKATSHLETLYVEGCPSLKYSSSDQFSYSLRILSICYCTTKLLESLYQLRHLTVLSISSSPMLELFSERRLFIPSLLSFTLSSCENLRSLPNHLHNLTSLQNLEINDCHSLVSFPEGGLPPNLITFKIRNCKNLTQQMSEWGLDRLSSLKRLEVDTTSPSTDFVSFPDYEGLHLPTSLIFVFIKGFKNLKSISGSLHKLTCLEDLWIVSCPKLQYLPEDCLPPTLQILAIESCPLLKGRLLKEKGDYWPIIARIPYIKI
ncbi:putative disease resistance RPP13-like protein 1 [Hevea brasiliensis]|uniref:putative disease resistance RPP13-like protein 1 n=1 Tax=Hevea brasiliensis TaxID=3981 RepID=UPI0025D96E91|nr:putative disease resistance RPP13-like protein 1 [Hevea brasiliensis]